VEIGPADRPEDNQPISYAIGPGPLARLLGVAAAPPALGIASLVISLATLMVVDSASEIGDVHYYLHETSGAPLAEFRWGSGIRMGLALVALGLAIAGIRMLLGPRPKLTVGVEDLDADPAALDEMEAAVLANATAPPAWMAAVVGSGLLVSVVALAMNAAAFGYAMASHSPPPTATNGF
jgi:hypothetical protein